MAFLNVWGMPQGRVANNRLGPVLRDIQTDSRRRERDMLADRI